MPESLPDTFFYRLNVWRRTQLLLGLGSVVALTAAYISQYAFGLAPCALCLQQRVPYFVVIGVCIVSFLPGFGEKTQRLLLGSNVAVLLMETGFAFRHVGVERHWWPGPGCSDAVSTGGSLEDLRNAIANAPLVRCDVPAFEFAGLSMAGWNALYAFSFAVLGIAVAVQVMRDARKVHENAHE